MVSESTSRLSVSASIGGRSTLPRWSAERQTKTPRECRGRVNASAPPPVSAAFPDLTHLQPVALRVAHALCDGDASPAAPLSLGFGGHMPFDEHAMQRGRVHPALICPLRQTDN